MVPKPGHIEELRSVVHHVRDTRELLSVNVPSPLSTKEGCVVMFEMSQSGTTGAAKESERGKRARRRGRREEGMVDDDDDEDEDDDD